MKSQTQVLISHWRDAVPDDRMAHLVRDVSRAFVRSLGLHLEHFGIPVGHWTFLRALWESDGITQKELSDRVGVMEPTTFTAVKSMEALGYVERRQQLPNRKNVYIHLTDEGRALRKKLVPLAIASNEQAAKGITANELATARKVLLAMLDNLNEEEQQLAQVEPRFRLKAVAAAAPRKPAAAARTKSNRPAGGRPSQVRGKAA